MYPLDPNWQLLEGGTFKVISKRNKDNAEKAIVAHGGSVVQNEREDTVVVTERSLENNVRELQCDQCGAVGGWAPSAVTVQTVF
jgi:hypothetical protein